MSQVQFEEQPYTMSTIAKQQASPKKSKITAFLMNSGLAKDEKSAGYILLSILGTCFVAIIIIFVIVLRQPRITYNIRQDILKNLPADIKQNIQNANR